MTKLIFIGRILLIIFLLICIGVHVTGLLSPFSDEPVWSHIVHLVSYIVCLLCMIRQTSFAWLAYTIGAIYPFIYHARCAWQQYEVYHRYSAICVFVVVMMPIGLALLWRKPDESTS